MSRWASVLGALAVGSLVASHAAAQETPSFEAPPDGYGQTPYGEPYDASPYEESPYYGEQIPGGSSYEESYAPRHFGQFCGGFGNLPCPNGLACIDDPRDSCNPHAGGADCGGVCVASRGRHRSPRWGRPRWGWPGQPDWPPGPPSGGGRCGASVCGASEYCCNPSCGICAPDGGFCTQQVCESPWSRYGQEPGALEGSEPFEPAPGAGPETLPPRGQETLPPPGSGEQPAPLPETPIPETGTPEPGPMPFPETQPGFGTSPWMPGGEPGVGPGSGAWSAEPPPPSQ
jgi:hypothetical protein